MAVDLKMLGQILPAVTGLAGDAMSQVNSMIAMYQNQKRYDQMLGLNSDLLEGKMVGGFDLPFGLGNIGGHRDPSTSIPGQLKDFGAQWAPQSQQLYQNNLTELGNMRAGLIGSGDQERKDINRSFDALQGRNLADAASRGLTSSTIPYAIGANLNRNRADAIGGLEERLRQQRLGFESYALNAGNAAFDRNYNMQQALFTSPLQAYMDLTRERMNVIGDRQDLYPDQSLRANLAGASGSAVAPGISMPESDNSGIFSAIAGPATFLGGAALFGGMGGGGGAAAGGGGGKWFMGCIDGEAMVKMPGGVQKMLRDVDTGDFVKTSKGTFARVVFKDYGIADSRRSGMYVKIKTSRGTTLTLTRDHRVGGKEIGSYQPGQMIGNHRLMSMEQVPAVACGDLMVEGGGGYYVNGLAVDSMLEYMGAGVMFAETKAKAKCQ